jgi:hypothetical protein
VTVATKSVRKTTTAKKAPAKKAPAKKAAAAAKAPVKKAPVAPAPAAPRRTPRPPKPLLQVVRRPDGRALSFTERLEERMHKQFGHAGPICHQCRTNASRLALIAGA